MTSTEDGIFRWPAPLASVKPEWVDGYGHMNMGYYLVAYDLQTDRLWPRIGLGPELRAAGLGTFAAEAWLDYQREVTKAAQQSTPSAEQVDKASKEMTEDVIDTIESDGNVPDAAKAELEAAQAQLDGIE